MSSVQAPSASSPKSNPAIFRSATCPTLSYNIQVAQLDNCRKLLRDANTASSIPLGPHNPVQTGPQHTQCIQGWQVNGAVPMRRRR